MIFASIGALVFAAIFVFLRMRKWLPPETIRSVTGAVEHAQREGKYGDLMLLGLSRVMEAVIGAKGDPRRTGWQFFAFSVALLIIGLSWCDIRSGTVFGSRELPWTTYDRYVAIGIAGLQREESPLKQKTLAELAARKSLLGLLNAANRGYWKYAYSAAFIFAIAVLNCMFLFMSFLLTRHAVSELATASSWTKRLGVHMVHLSGSALLGLSVTLCIGVFFNPILWLDLLLAKYVSIGYVVLGALAAAIFEWYVADPWFKVLIAVTLLPGLCLILVSSADLIKESWRRFFAVIGERFTAPLLTRYGDVLIPAVATISIVALIFSVLLILS
jgi:hypothetical protein